MNFLLINKRKCYKSIRHFVFFLFLLFFSVNICIAQTLKEKDITIKTSKEPIEKVFTILRKETNFKFFYDKEVINNIPLITLDLRNVSLQKVLDQITTQSGLYFDRVDNTISVSRSKKSKGQVPKARKVTGLVLDENGEAIIGATVIEKGSSSNGIVTDMDGRFELEVSEQASLIVAYMGYTSQEVATGNQKNITVKLREDSQLLDEVVVVGYGTQKKTNLTGSVEVVKSKDLENRPVTNASALLQGRVSGMTFSTPSGGNSPGAAPTIQIRGQAALSGVTPPLVVIDGIPSDMNDFNTLNPNDIESVSILKDAAASAVYGARAPYGVMMVTTKMGKRNQKPVLQYSGNIAIVNPIRYPEMVDSYTFAVARNQAYTNARQTPHFTQDALHIIKDNVEHPEKYTLADLIPPVGDSWGYGVSSYCNNDFFDVWLRSSIRQQHDLSIKGGNDKTNYFVSTAYVYQPGILNFVEDIDDYKRFNVNGGLSTDINDWIKLTYRSRYSYSKSKEPSLGGDIGGTGRGILYNYMYGAWPTTPIKNPDGYYNEGNRIAMVPSGNRSDDQHRLDNVLALDINPMSGWNIHVDGTWRMFYQDYQALVNEVYIGRPSGSLQKLTNSSVQKKSNITNYWTLQGYTSYEKTIKGNSFKLMVGMQAEEQNNRGLDGSALKLFMPDMPSISISQGQRNINDSMNDWATMGFFGRLNYNYKECYLLELNGRYDGSGRYSRGNRWGFFPSASAGWNISEEVFWENVKPVVNFAKLRASYGALGNQGNSPGYIHIPTMSVGSMSSWVFDGARPTYVNTPGILNMSRSWEKITTTEIAGEFRLFGNRLSTELSWFNRLSSDIIGPATPLPSVLGTGAPEINNAAFTTKGWELQMGWSDMITPRLNYNVRFTLSDYKSKITKYNTSKSVIGEWYVGREFGEIWGYEVNCFLSKDDFNSDGSLKIKQDRFSTTWNTGDLKYEDLNKDGEITNGSGTVDNPGDMKKIGNSTPRYRYGLSLDLGYDFKQAGRLDLSMFFEGVGKIDYPGNFSFYYWGKGGFTDVSIYKGEHLNFYRDEKSSPELLEHLGVNTDAKFPRPYSTGEGDKNFQTNTKYMLNGAYMRMKNLTLSYTLPEELLKKVKTKNCRVYFSGENLFVISSLPKYIDPEQINGRMYPQQATYSFGLNIGF